MSGIIGALDQDLLRALNQFVGRAPMFDAAMLELVDLALLKGVVLMIVFWAIWFSRTPGSLGRRQLMAGILAVLVTGFVSRVLQHVLPIHARPLHYPDFMFQIVPGQSSDALKHWSSFPSDHAAFFAAMTTVLWIQSRAAGIAASLWTLIVVCLPRLYLGYHWPSDILGGLVLGVSVTVAFVRIAQSSAAVAWLCKAETCRPAAFYGAAFAVTYQIATNFNELRRLSSSGVGLVKGAWASLAGLAVN